MKIQAKIIKLVARIMFGRITQLDLQTKRAYMEKYAFAPKGFDYHPVNITDLPAEWITPPGASPRKIYFHLHGGAYVMGSITSHRSLAARIAKAGSMRVFLINYRLAPENPFPAALQDALVAYRWLLKMGVDPNKLIISGDSAGGGLALATMISLRQSGEPLPAAAVLMSPWTDLTCSGISFLSKTHLDPINPPGEVRRNAKLYAGEHDLINPLISPLYANLSNLPPIMIQSGSDDILLDDSLRLAKGIEGVGGKVRLDIWQNMVHVFQIFADIMPVSRHAIREIGRFSIHFTQC